MIQSKCGFGSQANVEGSRRTISTIWCMINLHIHNQHWWKILNKPQINVLEFVSYSVAAWWLWLSLVMSCVLLYDSHLSEGKFFGLWTPASTETQDNLPFPILGCDMAKSCVYHWGDRRGSIVSGKACLWKNVRDVGLLAAVLRCSSSYFAFRNPQTIGRQQDLQSSGITRLLWMWMPSQCWW